MKIALCPVNPTVGDLEGNVDLCLEAISRAAEAGAELVALPEMAIPGDPPRDILCDPSFVQAALEATDDLARRSSGGPPVLVGSLARAPGAPSGHPGLWDAAYLLRGGAATVVAAKRNLLTRDVFFDHRWFVPGPPRAPVEVAGSRVGVFLGGDLFEPNPDETGGARVDLVLGLAALPYERGVLAWRRTRAAQFGVPAAFVNLCGSTDELIYDGDAFLLGPQGESVYSGVPFRGESLFAEMGGEHAPGGEELSSDEELLRALALGIRDFVRKNGAGRVFLGLSGGIDSAVVAALAAEALGAGAVTAVAVPSRHTDPRSTESARELATSLGVGFEVVGLEPLHAAAESSLGDLVSAGSSAENIQARLRATVLMAFVNSRGGMLLNTSNKTELSLGYSTLYGDSAGALSPLGDLTKPEVVSLARWIRKTYGHIPDFTMERPPSAELAPGQVDPFEYDVVAPRMEALVRADRSDGTLRRSEHKRRSMGVILKVSPRAFGSGRLIPITRR